ncbi:Flp family type IVb pilin [Tessaracoccus sp. SD287]|uniref:Flp family type IVb pilin n=1 Tax=Tessaracoccus sp. SD287 TaxID=2782008 RepID=UPI001A96064F|nr:Flp family type IVb pilin [Tessaracoccus sp. SD287]MBO1031715.1 Flp family type IVb pilin [Tessaracoccus sp. SD287]
MNPLVSVYLFFANRFAGQKERGATAVEYGLLAALIAVVIITVVTTLGTELRGVFQSVVDGI